jgi:hypothetical protein
MTAVRCAAQETRQAPFRRRISARELSDKVDLLYEDQTGLQTVLAALLTVAVATWLVATGFVLALCLAARRGDEARAGLRAPL